MRGGRDKSAMPPISQTWQYGVLIVALVASAVTDVRYGKIFNAITYPAIVAGLVGHTLMSGFLPEGDEVGLALTGSLLGLMVGFLPMFVVWRMGGIGGGDAKLMAAVGALGGVEFVVSATLYGCMVAVLMAMVIMIRRRVLGDTMKRIFGFLYSVLIKAKPTDPATPDSPKLAFGLALCIGSAAAIAELLIRGRLWLER